MATGFAPYILGALKNSLTDPHMKVDMHGFTKFLYTHPGQRPIQTTELTGGGQREVRFWTRPRFTSSMVDSAYDCNDVNVPARIESTVAVTKISKFSIFITQALMKQYETEASTKVAFPGANPQPTSKGATAEVLDLIYSAANAILKHMNTNLLGQLTWGKNSVTGSAGVQTINIPLASTSNNPVNDGWSKVVSDYKSNGLVGKPVLVGTTGLPFQAVLRAGQVSMGDTLGVDARLQTSMFDYYADQDYTADTNGFGVFEPGSVQVVEYLETLYHAGPMGVSTFFTMPIPVVDPNGNSVPVLFDCQLREIDCPTTQFTDTYNGGYLSAGNSTRGYQLTMWKNYDLYQIPSTNYHSTDVQYQNNGSLRFKMTNA